MNPHAWWSFVWFALLAYGVSFVSEKAALAMVGAVGAVVIVRGLNSGQIKAPSTVSGAGGSVK